MFDFSFSELALIGAVALVVIGPERLPKVARTAGIMFGRMQRYVTTVKADIARELELDELKKLQGQMHDAARTMEQSFNQQVAEAEQEVNKVASEARESLSSGFPTGDVQTQGHTLTPPAVDSHAAPDPAVPAPVASGFPTGDVQTTGHTSAPHPEPAPHLADGQAPLMGEETGPSPQFELPLDPPAAPAPAPRMDGPRWPVDTR